MTNQAAEKKFTARQLKTAMEIAKGAGFTTDKVDSKSPGQEREASAEVVALTTFNYLRAQVAQRAARSARSRQGYTIARAYAAQAGIYTLDLHGRRGSLPDRIAALQQRIARAIAKIYPDAK